MSVAQILKQQQDDISDLKNSASGSVNVTQVDNSSRGGDQNVAINGDIPPASLDQTDPYSVATGFSRWFE